MTKKRLVSIHGSPRQTGNSTTLAAQIEDGARAMGADVVSYYIHGMSIRPCAACDGCRESTDAECIVDDDMQRIYPELRTADALCIASPIYWFSASAQTKLFIDRCYALGGPEGHLFRGKAVAIALSYEDSDPFRSGAVNALRSFQDMFAYVGARIVGTVYGSAGGAGEIAAQTDLLDAARSLGQRLVA